MNYNINDININNIAIGLRFSGNLANMENIRKCNLIIDLPKFTFNKKMLSEIVVLSYN